MDPASEKSHESPAGPSADRRARAFCTALLACPRCRAPLTPGPRGATLRCPAGHGPLPGGGYPVEAGIARLLPADTQKPLHAAERRTIRAFERQWRGYGRLPRLFGKDEAAMEANLVGDRIGRRIDRAWYPGRVVLDAGCGHGRYLAAFARLGARVVGMDVGRGPEEAGVPRDDPRIALVQGSVLAPPFGDASFDLVFCDGVIHHTPDARGAFLALARLVKPGGALYVWVYPREGRLREAVFGVGRAFTTRLPGPLVRVLALALAPLTLFVRSYSGTRLGRATWAECAQVVHDWIAPPLQSHHTWEELAGWAAEAGLDDPERLPVPVGLIAWRPGTGP